ncbi:hypothetical protein ACTJK4_11945 [Ralstonia sp. 22111]|uniref:hypothetical protein n=1 Tax=Ralstonia sp. 22111 TaxID=3453878 RepID=UPI003F874565
MNLDLSSALASRLVHDYGFKERSNKLENGTCPSCGKRSLWAFADAPWVVRCNRLKNCAAKRVEAAD